MKIVVSGSRDATVDQHYTIIEEKLEEYNTEDDNITLIHGNCRGVDKICASIATSLGWKVIAVSAEWSKFGVKAGPIRNRKMLVDYKPDVLIAFPAKNSLGTVDMINQAKSLKVSVDTVMLP